MKTGKVNSMIPYFSLNIFGNKPSRQTHTQIHTHTHTHTSYYINHTLQMILKSKCD
jgi:hypothetical protein